MENRYKDLYKKHKIVFKPFYDYISYDKDNSEMYNDYFYEYEEDFSQEKDEKIISYFNSFFESEKDFAILIRVKFIDFIFVVYRNASSGMEKDDIGVFTPTGRYNFKKDEFISWYQKVREVKKIMVEKYDVNDFELTNYKGDIKYENGY